MHERVRELQHHCTELHRALMDLLSTFEAKLKSLT